MDISAPPTVPHVPPPPEEAGRGWPSQVAWTWVDCLGVLVLAPVLTIGLFLLVLVLVMGLGGAFFDQPDLGFLTEDIVALLSGIVLFLVLIGTAFGWVRLRYRGQARRLLGWSRPRGRDALLGVGLGVLAFGVLNAGFGTLLEWLAQLAGTELPAVQQEYQELVRNTDTTPYFMAMAVVFAPLAEELFFRGMLFPALAKRLGVGGGIALSAFVFAILHIGTGATADPAGNLLLAALIFPLGLLLAYSYHRRGTLVVPIALHAGFNLVSVLVLAYL